MHRKRKMTAQKTKMMFTSLIFIILFILMAGCKQPAGDAARNPTLDVIRLDGMKMFGSLERPAVAFPHDRHTDLIKDAGGCRDCHQPAEKGVRFSFVSMTGMSDRVAMNTWHDRCIGCHELSLDSGHAGGPLTCGECHPKQEISAPAIQTPNFYDTYHELHEELDGGCGLCHHEYDARTEKLYYEEGMESACRECHQDSPEDNIPSIRAASHLSCVNCHLETGLREGLELPVDCSDCHEPGPAPVQ